MRICLQLIFFELKSLDPGEVGMLERMKETGTKRQLSAEQRKL